MRTLSERKAAACELLVEHPDWSTRRIARAAGLAPHTVEVLRQRNEQEVRVGANGRPRPLNIERGRLAAQSILTAYPHMSLRDVAHRVGISPNTVRDVRDRMRRGEDPVRRTKDDAAVPATVDRGPRRRGPDPEDTSGPRPISAALPILRLDPTIRYTVAGRRLIGFLTSAWMAQRTIEHLVSAVPAHHREQIAACARECASTWQSFASALDEQDSQPVGGERMAR